MFGITVSEAAAICGGSVYGKKDGNREISRLTIDSRDIQNDDMFVAYRGEHSDGHKFIASALENGAACALAEYLPEEALTGPVILCNDVQEAVEKIAAAFRARIKVPIVGVTGSVGKTTAKEMIASVLEQKMKVHRTAGNLNNTIGLPISLCGMHSDDECAVLEMGINHFGEMRRLGRIAVPDIAVYTIIGHAHLEFLGDLNGVLKAKTEMLEFMSDDSLLIVNGDDILLRNFNCRQRKLTFGRSDGCDIRGINIANSTDGFVSCDIMYCDRKIHAEIPGFGEHLVYAALAAAAVGFSVGLTEEDIRRGIANYKTVGRRLAVEDTNVLRLIDDCYNANPDSCHSSICTLASIPGRHVCILGDMLELGTETAKMHREIGVYAAQKGIEQLVTCGQLAQLMADEYNRHSKKAGKNAIPAISFSNTEALIAALPTFIKKDDIVLVKASRGSHLETVSEALKRYKGE